MARLSKSEKLKREQRLREMGGILLFGLAFLALAIIFLPSGLTGHLGGVLKQGFFGLFGSISYFLPLLFIYLALELLLAKELILSRKRQVLSLFLLLTIMCLIAVFSLNEDSLIYHALKDGQVKASEVLKALWRAPAAEQIANYKSFWNGGFFASVISLGLMNLLGKVGAVLFLLIALLVIMLFLFNFSYVYFVKSGYVSLKEKREAFLRAREESRAESLARAEFESEQENLEAPEANNFSNPEAEGYLAEADLINSRSDELSGWDSSSELSKHQIKNQYLDPDSFRTAETRRAPRTLQDQSRGSESVHRRRVPRRPFNEELRAVEAGPRASKLKPEFRSSASLDQEAELSYQLPEGDWRQANLSRDADRETIANRAELDLDNSMISSEADALSQANLPSESEELREEQAVPEANDSENLKSSSSKQGKSEASQSKAVQPDSPSAKPDGAEESQEILERAQKIEALKESLQDEDERQAWLDRSAEAERLAQKASSFELYAAPPLKLLQLEEKIRQSPEQEEEIRLLGATLEKTLNDFGIDAKVVNYTSGPTISRFEIVPGPGIKVSRIVNLADDIALALAATAVRIEAPIPGKSAVGIEIPNKQTRAVLLRGILEDKRFKENKAPLLAALGRDIQGEPIFCDLAKMPHLLIAGATGSGKSVCINSILISLLYRTGPENLRLLMIDPKVVELSVYNGIPHLLQPVVTNPKKATGVLRWAVDEMSRRYNLFATAGVRDFRSFNAWLASGKRLDDPKLSNEKLPYIVLVIDELSDLMATSANEVEESISRLTAMARAAGIHLIIATQRPSVDVITGVIKANIPSRIAFAVASQVDSRTILDLAGAEKLLGKGDMLYAPQSSAKSLRGQGSFVTDGEVEAVVSYLKHNYGEQYDEAVGLAIDKADQGSATASSGGSGDSEDYDELLADAMQICLDNKYASISLLQRRLNVGYPRAARMVDQLHDLGAIGPFEGSKPRTIAVKDIDEFHAKLNGLEEK